MKHWLRFLYRPGGRNSRYDNWTIIRRSRGKGRGIKRIKVVHK